jgi:restriction system protein
VIVHVGSAYDQQAAETAEAAQRHNKEIDRFERDFRSGDSNAVAQFFTLVLDPTLYPEGFPHRTRAMNRPEPRELIVEYQLVDQGQSHRSADQAVPRQRQRE